MDFEVVASYGNDRRKVVGVIPRRHNGAESWTSAEVITYTWHGAECYTYSESGKATARTGADYKLEISLDLETAYPKARALSG